MENLKFTFEQVKDWIKTADQKAMILGSFNLVGFVYQLVKLDKVINGSRYTVILFIISIASTLIALFFWLRIIYPKLDNNHKKSKIYFQHIANAYEYDISEGVRDLQNVEKEEYERDLAYQIIIKSVIAKKKYANIQKFIWVFGVQVATLVLLFISLL